MLSVPSSVLLLTELKSKLLAHITRTMRDNNHFQLRYTLVLMMIHVFLFSFVTFCHMCVLSLDIIMTALNPAVGRL